MADSESDKIIGDISSEYEFLSFPCNILFSGFRQLVSNKRRRFREDGFDLDLTILTDRIIIHGFPAVGIEYMYRNPRNEIRRFLETYHARHYFVYNFCAEPKRDYDGRIFRNRLKKFPFADHCTPPLQTMVDFAEDAKSWLDLDEKNVCSLHCVAGKGRSGLMSCVLMLRCGVHHTAEDTISNYNKLRTKNGKALTRCCQRKYVKFYEMLWRKFWGISGNIGEVSEHPPVPPQPEIFVESVEIVNIGALNSKRLGLTVFRCSDTSPALIFNAWYQTVQRGVVEWMCNVKLQMDFMLRVEREEVLGRSTVLFEFWYNTLFVDIQNLTSIEFGWEEMDIKKKNIKKTLGEDMKLRLNFEGPRKSSELRQKPSVAPPRKQSGSKLVCSTTQPTGSGSGSEKRSSAGIGTIDRLHDVKSDGNDDNCRDLSRRFRGDNSNDGDVDSDIIRRESLPLSLFENHSRTHSECTREHMDTFPMSSPIRSTRSSPKMTRASSLHASDIVVDKCSSRCVDVERGRSLGAC